MPRSTRSSRRVAFRAGEVWTGLAGRAPKTRWTRRGVTHVFPEHVRSVDLESGLAFIMVTEAFRRWTHELYNPEAVYSDGSTAV